MHEVEGARETPFRPVPSETAGSAPIVCFSHLGWYFVFQRPHHLMSRAARSRAVFFWEEPLYEERDDGVLEFEPVARRRDGAAASPAFIQLRPRLGRFAAAIARWIGDGTRARAPAAVVLHA